MLRRHVLPLMIVAGPRRRCDLGLRDELPIGLLQRPQAGLKQQADASALLFLQAARGRPALGDGVRSAELLKWWLESCAMRGIPCLQFAEKTCCCHRQSPAQLRFIERADECLCERTGHGGGEAIEAAPEDGVLSQTEAGEGERVIADPTDPVFG